MIAGNRCAASVSFSKLYVGAPFGYENPVAYSGTLSGSGDVITGRWTIGGFGGVFEMHRQESAAAKQKAETAETVSAS